jgi:hypothetical protein
MLSKRLAGQFLQAMFPTGGYHPPEELVSRAFACADAFIAESNLRGIGTGIDYKPRKKRKPKQNSQ